VFEHAEVGRGVVGDDLVGLGDGGGEGPVEESARSRGVPPLRDVHVDDLPVLVDRAVHVPPGTGDLHIGLV
jgi:hypothetical protein